ncbi:TetR family transcriptional regulator [Nucisporomicrobium flavum]|uniref:TetR family transcriptional regulator n=1 Tax=Nucisporomicrobium flavum TaxID=2785915 RepID=UPI0018F6622D|nr:TetR family transcriptional regulator [Nucisporomicrobium flavum]
MASDQVPGGARARARRAMRDQVAATAVALFLERGFDGTTVDDICARADISRSTFFRYFPTKEEALFGRATETGRAWLEALIARPAGEPPWVALRRSLDPRLRELADAGEAIKPLMRLILATPALAAHHREKNAYWQDLLRPEVARRLGADPDDAADPRAEAMVAAALGCLDAALRAWMAGGQELPELLDRAMAVIG